MLIVLIIGIVKPFAGLAPRPLFTGNGSRCFGYVNLSAWRLACYKNGGNMRRALSSTLNVDAYTTQSPNTKHYDYNNHIT